MKVVRAVTAVKAVRVKRRGCTIPLLPPLPLLPATERQEISKQPKCPGHPGGQLPEEAQPGIHIGAFPHGRDQKPTGERRLARVMGFKHRAVVPIPAACEVESPLLDPSLPVGGAKAVRFPEQWMIRDEEADRSAFISYPVVAHRQGRTG